MRLSKEIKTDTSDRITEIIARGYVAGEGIDPDQLRHHPGSDYHGKPEWHWFIARAEALRDFLTDHGFVVRPKDYSEGR